MQEGLASTGNEWVSLHRDFDPAEIGAAERTVRGTSEISMRNQFRAWSQLMAEGMRADAAGTQRQSRELQS